MKNLLPLPDHICRLVYMYDQTYHDIYNVCMMQLQYDVKQKKRMNEFLIEHNDVLRQFLVEQELERNIFTFSSDLFIDSLLNKTPDEIDIADTSFFQL